MTVAVAQVVGGLLAVYFTVLLARAVARPSPLPALPTGGVPSDRDDLPRVSIVVAVRNEMDRTLENSLDSLRHQNHANFEVVAVDDHSDDGSRAVLDVLAAADPRLRVVSAAPGAQGKRAALAQGVATATGSWLLFTDADVWLAPDALTRAHTLACRERLDAISLLPRTIAISLAEQVALAATGWLVYAGKHLRRCNDDGAGVGLAAAGPFLLVRRDAYDAVGGYAAMRQNVLIDVALAQRLRGSGFRYRYLASKGAVEARMYRSLPEIWHGFGKNACLALGGRLDVALAAAIGGTAVVVLPFLLAPALMARGDIAGTVLAAIACATLTAVQQRGAAFLGTAPRPLALALAPAGALLWLAIVVHSVYRTSVRSAVVWKRRTLPVFETPHDVSAEEAMTSSR